MAVIISVDAGTTGVRSIAFDPTGRTVAESYREFAQHYPSPGWVEHDADEIWDVTRATLAEVCARVEEPVAAIGITDQRETVVMWSRSTGRPLHRAIVWQDRRTAARCDELAAEHLEAVRSTTGLVLDPYFSATKIEWLGRHGGVDLGPDTAFGTVDSWLLWNLTAGSVHATDVSNASRTMLCDLSTGTWSDDMCELFGVPHHVLPEIMASSGRFGTTSGVDGVPDGLPISGIAGDQQASLFGQGCFSPGMSKNTYGTGSFVLMNVGEDLPAPAEGLLTTIAWTLPASALGGTGDDVRHYALEGAIFITGAAVQWLRDELGIIEHASDIGPLAESVDDTGGVVLVPAFTGLGSPWWDPYARGALLGITRGTGRAEIARAVVESMAYQTRDVVDAMTSACSLPINELRVDGGASVMPLLRQLVADQIGVDVVRPAGAEITALGAAYLAGLAEGVWSTVDEVSEQWAVDDRVAPRPDVDRDTDHQRWRRAVERAGGWAID